MGHASFSQQQLASRIVVLYLRLGHCRNNLRCQDGFAIWFRISGSFAYYGSARANSMMKCCQFLLLTQWSSISCSSARTLSFFSSEWRSCSFTFCSLALSFVFSFLCSWGKGYGLCFLPKCVLHNICENSVLVIALDKIHVHSQIAFLGPHSGYLNTQVSRIIGPLLIDAANFSPHQQITRLFIMEHQHFTVIFYGR